MEHSWKEGRLKPPQKRALLWAIVAFIACLAMNAYHYSLEGAKGLYLWNRTGLFRALILMGFIPAGVAFLSFPLEKLKNKLPSRLCRGISIGLSLLVTFASIGLLTFLIAGPRMGRLEPARLSLVNPAGGIVALQEGRAAFKSGAVSTSNDQTVSGSPGADKALLRLSFSSDPHWGADNADMGARLSVLASVAEHKPDAFFMLGDTVETGSKAEMWDFALSDLEAVIPKVPLRPIMGNHDALFGGQYLYKKAFFPASFRTDSGSPYFYSVKADAATILVLDLPWGTEEYRGRQRSWFENALKTARPGKPIIVLSHSYFYASGYDDPDYGKPWYDHYQDIPAIAPLLERYGVDLVVSGHNHYQEFLEHKGVRYAIIGAMGGKSDPSPAYVSPASKWLASGTHGRLDADIMSTGIVLSFRDEAGALLHEEKFAY